MEFYDLTDYIAEKFRFAGCIVRNFEISKCMNQGEQLELSGLLELLGFKQFESQRDFVDILNMSGAFDHAFFSSFHKENAGCDISSVECTKKVIDYLNRHNNGTSAYDWLEEVLQKKFWARQAKKGENGHKERWEASTPSWIVDNREALIPIVRRLGLCDAVLPSKKDFDSVVVLGSTKEGMDLRMNWVAELIQDKKLFTKRIYIATGARYIINEKNANDPEDWTRDGGAEYLSKLANIFGIDLDQLTETHISAEIAVQHFGKLGFKLRDKEKWGNFDSGFDSNGGEIILVDSPLICDSVTNVCSRPNTESSLQELLKIMDKKEVNILVTTMAPYILSQGRAVEYTLQKEPGIVAEIAGGRCEIHDNASASQIYALFETLAGAYHTHYIREIKK